MATLVGILGSATPPGRSLMALRVALDAARDFQPGTHCVALNLADYRVSFADGRPPDRFDDDTGRVVAQIQAADAVLLFSPVYRGSFSGVLKNLLDQLPVDALRGKPCGIAAVGATQHHYLGVDWHLRDVLAWFGAIVAPVSVYLSSADFPDGQISDDARREVTELAVTVMRLQSALGRGALGPPPLAARR
jgi:NAD(P)H-dependent FMN reductase